jgi:hypothetical protein
MRMCPNNVQFISLLLLWEILSLVGQHLSAILMGYEDMSQQCAISFPAAAKTDTVQSLVCQLPSAIVMAYEDVSKQCAISFPAAAKADTVSSLSASMCNCNGL